MNRGSRKTLGFWAFSANDAACFRSPPLTPALSLKGRGSKRPAYFAQSTFPGTLINKPCNPLSSGFASFFSPVVIVFPFGLPVE